MPKLSKIEKVEDGVIENILYDGKVKVKFFGPSETKPNRHSYFVYIGKESWRPKSVTSIIGIIDKSKALIPWACELSADFLFSEFKRKKTLTQEDVYLAYVQSEIQKEKAANLGTKVHTFAEEYILYKLGKGKMPQMPDDDQVLLGVNSFLEWEKQHDVKFISSERVVYSKKYDYIGTLDIEAKIDGHRCLVDLKTSNALYNTVRLQTAAYVKADEEENGKKYYGRWAVRISKETEEEYMTRMIKKQQKARAKALSSGKEVSDNITIPAYEIFEAKYLDENKTELDEDFEAFINFKKGQEWCNKTDFFYNK